MPSSTSPSRRRLGREPLPPPTLLRDRVLEVKREEIVRVASELFYAQGFTQTSMDQIAARLSIGKPQIYACFPSKTALLAEVCNLTTALAASVAAEAEQSQGTPTERVVYVVRELSRRVIDGRMHLAVLFREVKHLPQGGINELARNFHAFNRSFEALLKEGEKTGEFQVSHPAVVTHAVSGMTTWMYSWFRPDGPLPAEAVIEDMVQLALRMVGINLPHSLPTKETPTDRRASSKKAQSTTGSGSSRMPKRS